MVIQCDQCQTKFRLPDEKLKPGGVKVRCSHCKHVFTVMPPDAALEQPAPTEKEPTAPVPSAPQAVQEETSSSAAAGAFPADMGGDDESPSTEAQGGEGLEGEASTGFDIGEFDETTSEQEFGASTEESSSGLDFGADFDSELPTDKSSESGDASGDGPTGLAVDGGDHPEGFGSDEEAGPSEFDFGDQSSTTSEVGDEFSFDNEEAVVSDEFDFGEEAGSSEEFGFEEESSGTTGGGDEFGFGEEESASSDEFDFGDENPFGDEEFGEAEKEFKFTELPSTGGAVAPEQEPSSSKESASADFGAGAFEESFSQEELLEPIPKVKKGKKAKGAKGGKDTKGPLSRVLRLILLLLLLLCAAAAYLFWQSGGVVSLPSMDEFVERITGGGSSEVSGHIELSGEAGRYVVNRSAGNLLVIEGRAVNRYPHGRAIIRVRGILYDAQGKALRKQMAYCGNRLSEKDLQQLPFAKIEEAMNNTFGEALSNLDVAQGKDIPFVLVFRDLPPELDSFAVEVVDSQTASK